ncbi:MAG: helix-turn-helix domain-containing protein, partial [Dehalococcoidia bacterium]|nr:helix-turn-helix domain-containing protein [Dehalococcoidia bacterium]
MSSIASPVTTRQAAAERAPRGAFQRYLALLEGLATAPPHASVRDIARRARLAPATAHRLLHELIELGVVYEDVVTGRYGLTSTLWVLLERFGRRDELRVVALPIMQELRNATGETATLVVPLGRERVCILQVESRQHAHYGAAVGVPDRLDVGAPGKVLLAFGPPT